MKIKHYFILLGILLIGCSNSNDPVRPSPVKDFISESIEASKPFPQALSFANCIKPNNLTQEQINADVQDYYNYWFKKYLRTSNGTTPGGGYYVSMKGTGGDGMEITTSEAHGYGMIIFALMAGYDDDAKKYYDGMLNMFEKHPSTGNPHCMSWIIHETELNKHDAASASDGDMDIAYSMLLAHQQWGSNGLLNYLDKAQTMITKGLKVSDVSATSKRTMLGDWDSNAYSTRSSDWMTAHFRNYQKATSDQFWSGVADKVYRTVESLTTNYSPQTGLMPDFIVDKTPKPAPEYYLDEFKETDEYCWNACRYPWRITTDYAHFGTPEAKEAMVKLLDFMVANTDNKPSEIRAGYHLNGTPLVSYSSGAFTAPMVTATIVDAKYQEFLNKGWGVIKSNRNSYYDDTICLLNMLLISGNWWNPTH